MEMIFALSRVRFLYLRINEIFFHCVQEKTQRSEKKSVTAYCVEFQKHRTKVVTSLSRVTIRLNFYSGGAELNIFKAQKHKKKYCSSEIYVKDVGHPPTFHGGKIKT